MKILAIELQNLPTQGHPHMHLCAVLVGGEIDDYVVYVGGADMPDPSVCEERHWDIQKNLAANYVARAGNKLSFEKAQMYFYGLKVAKYRS